MTRDVHGFKQTVTSPTGFMFVSPHSLFSAWEASDGRWYWHRKAGGRVTDDGSYASRRSTRRALIKKMAREGAV